MVGTPEGGKKAYEAIKDKYGLDQIKEWGALGAKAIKNHRGGFNNPQVVKVAASTGGKNGSRCRVITKDSKLRWDEWGMLADVVCTMMYSSTVAMKTDSERVKVYETLAFCLIQRDWQTLMSCWGDFGLEYDESFEYALKLRLQEAKIKAQGTDYKSSERNEYRILRNLVAAYNVAKGKE